MAADKFINDVGLVVIKQWIEGKFATQDSIPTDLSDLTNTGQDPFAQVSDIPTKVSDLTNDGDGTQGSEFATKDYVDANAGAIASISIDGTTQTIDANKNVALDLSDYAKVADVPTKVSDLTNDSGFQDATDVSTAISTALANSGDAYQTESDVDTKISTAMTSAMTYKGSVATVADLPSSGNKVGDFYNVTATGDNYAWDGSDWDKAGGVIDTSTLWSNQSGQTNSLLAMTTAEINAILNPSA